MEVLFPAIHDNRIGQKKVTGVDPSCVSELLFEDDTSDGDFGGVGLDLDLEDGPGKRGTKPLHGRQPPLPDPEDAWVDDAVLRDVFRVPLGPMRFFVHVALAEGCDQVKLYSVKDMCRAFKETWDVKTPPDLLQELLEGCEHHRVTERGALFVSADGIAVLAKGLACHKNLVGKRVYVGNALLRMAGLEGSLRAEDIHTTGAIRMGVDVEENVLYRDVRRRVVQLRFDKERYEHVWAQYHTALWAGDEATVKRLAKPADEVLEKYGLTVKLLAALSEPDFCPPHPLPSWGLLPLDLVRKSEYKVEVNPPPKPPARREPFGDITNRMAEVDLASPGPGGSKGGSKKRKTREGRSLPVDRGDRLHLVLAQALELYRETGDLGERAYEVLRAVPFLRQKEEYARAFSCALDSLLFCDQDDAGYPLLSMRTYLVFTDLIPHFVEGPVE
eukprot:jgi/Mesvir1/12478/Mv07847-RA.1